MSDLLSEILVSTYKLTIKSQIYHWNVVGPLFKSLHELTEEHYNALFEAADIVAERIRALGHLAPATVGETSGFSPKGQGRRPRFRDRDGEGSDRRPRERRAHHAQGRREGG